MNVLAYSALGLCLLTCLGCQPPPTPFDAATTRLFRQQITTHNNLLEESIDEVTQEINACILLLSDSTRRPLVAFLQDLDRTQRNFSQHLQPLHQQLFADLSATSNTPITREAWSNTAPTVSATWSSKDQAQLLDAVQEIQQRYKTHATTWPVYTAPDLELHPLALPESWLVTTPSRIKALLHNLPQPSVSDLSLLLRHLKADALTMHLHLLEALERSIVVPSALPDQLVLLAALSAVPEVGQPVTLPFEVGAYHRRATIHRYTPNGFTEIEHDTTTLSIEVPTDQLGLHYFHTKGQWRALGTARASGAMLSAHYWVTP